MKKILIILDGAADLPNDSLNGKTPLEAADTPNLDFFSKNGKMGFMYPINEEIAPGSDNSIISLFGNDYKNYKRGTFEATGLGYKLKDNDMAFRANFGTIDNLKSKKVIDRRAGRTLSTEEAKKLAHAINEHVEVPVDFEFSPAVQHRGVLVLRSNELSEKITNIDPEWGPGGSSIFNFSEPLDEDPKSRSTSNYINEFVNQAYKVLNNHPVNVARVKKGLLAANMIFLRGGGIGVPKMKKYKNWMSINAMPLEIGISILSGMKTFSFPYPELKDMDSYKNLHDGLNATIKFAIKTIKSHGHYTGCYIQFKETDVPGHDNKPNIKKEFIEIIDKNFFSFLRKYCEKKNIKVVVTCDHTTPCKLKKHSSDPVPVLVYDSKGYDGSIRFTENEAKTGSIGKIYGHEFMEKTGLV